jgi:hypothetical protein
MKRRFTFLGFEFYWMPDRKGIPRVKRRTARNKLQAACRRIKTWIRDNRHLRGPEFFRGLNRRLRGHYQYYGVRGNSRSLYRFYEWAIRCTSNGSTGEVGSDAASTGSGSRRSSAECR